MGALSGREAPAGLAGVREAGPQRDFRGAGPQRAEGATVGRRERKPRRTQGCGVGRVLAHAGPGAGSHGPTRFCVLPGSQSLEAPAGGGAGGWIWGRFVNWLSEGA